MTVCFKLGKHSVRKQTNIAIHVVKQTNLYNSCKQNNNRKQNTSHSENPMCYMRIIRLLRPRQEKLGLQQVYSTMSHHNPSNTCQEDSELRRLRSIRIRCAKQR